MDYNLARLHEPTLNLSAHAYTEMGGKWIGFVGFQPAFVLTGNIRNWI
jgi:hypothetical protein